VGLVGSIDNDMVGTDMTIGADTALHRIVSAVDAISSTAASHQRAFVVEVMGRHCGYLALMGAIAAGADFVLIPENPPDVDDWEATMCKLLHEGRRIGRRDSIVMVAEGAIDRRGNPITSAYVQKTIEERLGEDVRVTVLGHVQRGGAPSAYDRILSTLMGVAAANAVLEATATSEPVLIGSRNNRIVQLPLIECVEKNLAINEAVGNLDFAKAMAMRGGSFQASFDILRTLVRALPHPPTPGQKQIRFAILNAGGAAPGMNAAVRAAVRLGLDNGHMPLGVQRGFRGLINDDVAELHWASVSGWAAMGGSELGTSRKVPEGRELYSIARTLEKHQIEAILIVGGWSGYKAALQLYNERQHYPAFNIPILCLPASIDNNLPFAEYSIGSDTALNSIAEAVDKIKQSAVASNRCFVVEVMGRHCGYLALMTTLATGAERAYIHEEGITLSDLQRDINMLKSGFRSGKRLGLMIRNEQANSFYTTNFLASLFEEEGDDLFDVRMAVLGHLQQGGDPSPFDRITATRMANAAIHFMQDACTHPAGEAVAACYGMIDDQSKWTPLYDIARHYDEEFQRPKQQWWMNLRPIVRMLAQPEAGFEQQKADR
ncbi:MAG: 6-phosphofructokinase, partial [Chloroflexota bacterium]|nr:6-phosphofructokinase [Chloroflexota bacterium]